MIALLLSLILAATGIPRSVDADLTAIAERRVIEVQSNWSHDGWVPGTGEVIAWNIDYPDPAAHAVEQWQGSAPHWAILTDLSYTRIGCAHTVGIEGRDFFVCVLSGGPVAAPAPPVAPTPTPAPPIVLLPNTAMEAP